MSDVEKIVETDNVENNNVENDVVLQLKDMQSGENPAAQGKLVFRNSREDLLKIADRIEFVEELQEFVDEVRDFAEEIGKKHGVKLNMEVLFELKKIKFRRSQVK